MNEIDLAVTAEQAVRDVFEKRYAGRLMPYEQARELVFLERELVENLVFCLKRVISDEEGGD